MDRRLDQFRFARIKSLSLPKGEYYASSRCFPWLPGRLPDTSGELHVPVPVNVPRRHLRSAGPGHSPRCAATVEPLRTRVPSGVCASAQGSPDPAPSCAPGEPAPASRRRGPCRAGSLHTSINRRHPWPAA